jgi:hypothetical protein
MAGDELHMKSLILLALLFLAAPVLAQETTAKPQLGINLSGLTDWGTELPFVDIFHASRGWISQRQDESWGNGPALELDENGWVKSLEPDCYAELPFLVNMVDHHPGGAYTLLYDGEGTFTFKGGTVVEDSPGRKVIEVASSSMLWLRLTETTPGNHVRNIRLILPGFEDTYDKEPFHPVFLARWKGMKCLRFMDWMSTNASQQEKWQNRPKVSDASWAKDGGVPLEVLIDLSNRLKIDPWFCMPAKADDDYVRQFASLVKEKLDPSLKPHIEYSNEIWNNSFEQAKWAQAQGQELGLGEPARPWEGRAMFYVQRSLEIFKIWEQTFGGKARLVRILAWQAASAPNWTDGLLMSGTQGAEDVDALVIAPYMSLNVSMDDLSTVASWSVDQVLDHVENVSLPDSIKWMETQKSVADKYGVKLFAYESGQHLVGVGGAQQDEALAKLFHEVNRHPRMGALYTRYYDAWASTGGDMMAVFTSIHKWGTFGSWGLAEYYDQQPSDSPKYKATMEWAKSKGQDVTLKLPLN